MSESKTKSRRQFLQNAAATGGGITAAGLVSNAPALAQSTSAGTQQTTSKTADVVIAGGGMAGVCTAIAAVQAGARVIVIEAWRETGGTGLLSSGNVHSQGALDWPAMQKIMPNVDPVYGQVHMAKYIDTIEWLKKTGAPAFNPAQAAAAQGGQTAGARRQGAPPQGEGRGGGAGGGGGMYGISLNLGRSYEGKRQTFDYLNGLILKNGEILLKTKFHDLITNASGRVIGVHAIQENGATLTVNARKAVVLAAGGFGYNKEMVARYYGPQADLSASRSVPYNDATAILAAQRLGAMLSRGMTGFYGHLQPFPVLLPQTPEDFDAFDKNLFNAIGGSIQSFTSRAIVVNQDGLRFADESLGDEQVAQGVLRQRHATCWTIFDSSAVPTPDRLKTLQTQKAVLLTADTLDDLIGKIGPYGVHTINLAQTLADFNKAAQEKAGGRMTPAHGGTLAAITRAPFFGIQVTAGISGTYGGLKINTKGQVLGPCSLPIPGLYAAPHTAGGIFYETYGGSLGGCAVWGRIAGTNAGAEKSV